MSSSNIEQLDEARFAEAVAGSTETPLVVDFWAPWCGPCRALAPVLDALAAELPGIKIAKVNVDEFPGLAAGQNVGGIPALLFYKGGKLVGRSVGAKPKEVLSIEFQKLL
ncbi:MAG: thioredoxin [Puniceicoccales bacterium]|jgi:thioredoxin 1|nr:thioredoxin [Puniceicoccales bacterium]